LMKKFPELEGNEDWASVVSQDVFGGPDRPSGAAKFESYSTPGGIPGSYREVVTTLPVTPPEGYKVVSKGGKFNVQKPDGSFVTDPDGNRAVWSNRAAAESAFNFHTSHLNYTSSHWPGITNPLLHYRQKDFLNHADPTSVGSLEKVTQPKAAGEPYPGEWFHGRGPGLPADGFSDDLLGTNTGARNTSLGHFFVNDPYIAESIYAGRRGSVIDASLHMKNPKVIKHAEDVPIEDPGLSLDDFTKEYLGLRHAPTPEDYASLKFSLKMKGHDGIVIKSSDGLEHAIVFEGANVRPRSPSPQSGSGEGTTSGGAFRSPESNLPSKTRVLDEMQSDWAQRARDQGTRDPVKAAELKAAANEAVKRTNAALDEIMEFGSDPNNRVPPTLTFDTVRAWANDETQNPGVRAKAKELMDRYDAANNETMDLTNKLTAVESGVPSAPYISNTSDWVDLGLKQALIDAAKDPSVNRLAWAPGKVQADRYGLEKHIDEIRYVRDPRDDTYQVWASKSNAPVFSKKGVSAADLPEIFGREMADKIVNREGGKNAGILTGLDLRSGGEGMKSFYGDLTPEGYQSGIVGTRLQKLVKGLDPEAAKIETHTLDSHRMPKRLPDGTDERGWKPDKKDYPSVKITPAMREKILKEGLPLFNVAALSALLSRILGQGQSDEEQ
jgi:hypothetical protein